MNDIRCVREVLVAATQLNESLWLVLFMHFVCVKTRLAWLIQQHYSHLSHHMTVFLGNHEVCMKECELIIAPHADPLFPVCSARLPHRGLSFPCLCFCPSQSYSDHLKLLFTLLCICHHTHTHSEEAECKDLQVHTL